MRVTLIHNPDAGDDRLPTAGQLVALINEAGTPLRVDLTDEKQLDEFKTARPLYDVSFV